MSAKTEIGNVRLYLFWSLLKIPRFFSITENCKQKIWLKQPKAASALDFSYFQHASKLVTHHRFITVVDTISTTVIFYFLLFCRRFLPENRNFQNISAVEQTVMSYLPQLGVPKARLGRIAIVIKI